MLYRWKLITDPISKPENTHQNQKKEMKKSIRQRVLAFPCFRSSFQGIDQSQTAIIHFSIACPIVVLIRDDKALTREIFSCADAPS